VIAEPSESAILLIWAIADALSAADLICIRLGYKARDHFDDTWAGGATALWPTSALVELAETFLVTEQTRKDDWRGDRREAAKPKRVRECDLVKVSPLREPTGITLGVTPEMIPERERMTVELQAINAVNGAADIRGAGNTVTLVRRFQHSLGFGGRFYAPVSTLSPEERLAITIDGSPVVEVDVKASQLTVLLGLTRVTEAPADAYEVPGIPRDVVKSWAIQTLGSGRPPTKWSPKMVSAIKSGITAPAVWKALQPRYPFLGDLASLVPSELLSTVPEALHAWAAGQWVVMREAEIIAAAMRDLSRAGVAVLPIHDSLLVPEEAETGAKEALVEAFRADAGITPRLEVERANAIHAAETRSFWT
jgi:hypothetical protein